MAVCWNCKQDLVMDWHWFVRDLEDDLNSFVTETLRCQYNNNPRYELLEIEHCPNCLVDQ